MPPSTPPPAASCKSPPLLPPTGTSSRPNSHLDRRPSLALCSCATGSSLPVLCMHFENYSPTPSALLTQKDSPTPPLPGPPGWDATGHRRCSLVEQHSFA